MGFLEQGKDAFRIRAMSLHVVGTEEFVPEPELEEIAHEGFFLERIVENVTDAIFSFTDLSDVKLVIQQIVAGRRRSKWLRRQRTMPTNLVVSVGVSRTGPTRAGETDAPGAQRGAGAVRGAHECKRLLRCEESDRLRQRIVFLAQRHKRYGAGMIYLKLRRAGLSINCN